MPPSHRSKTTLLGVIATSVFLQSSNVLASHESKQSLSSNQVVMEADRTLHGDPRYVLELYNVFSISVKHWIKLYMLFFFDKLIETDSC